MWMKDGANGGSQRARRIVIVTVTIITRAIHPEKLLVLFAFHSMADSGPLHLTNTVAFDGSGVGASSVVKQEASESASATCDSLCSGPACVVLGAQRDTRQSAAQPARFHSQGPRTNCDKYFSTLSSTNNPSRQWYEAH